jgi:periplasmic divalent cation tolerance protein
MSPTDVLIVLCTFPSGESAAGDAATRVVEERLAASVSLLPGLKTVHRRKGTLSRDDDILAIIRTTSDRFAPLKVRLIELHPHASPEIIALEVERGHLPFLDWIRDSVLPEP